MSSTTEDNKKYYVPSIEEFHVGFECYNYSHLEGRYKPIKIGVFDLHELLNEELEDSLDLTHYKVKYLDREDLESLGWHYKDTTEVGIDYFWDIKTKSHSMIYDYRNKRMILTIFDYARLKDNTHFNGTIKNKSELLRLMRQIGINTK